MFSCTTDARVVTDLKGHISQVVEMAPASQRIILQADNARHNLIVRPNRVMGLADGRMAPLHAVPFDYPFAAGKAKAKMIGQDKNV